jgi:hypothetical protein
MDNLVCSCGVKLAEGDAFCQSCGTPAPAKRQGGGATQNFEPMHTVVYIEPPTAFASDLPEWSIEPPPAAVVKRILRN